MRSYLIGYGLGKDIYSLVLDAQRVAIDSIEPDVKFRDIHMKASGRIASGLKELSIMDGEIEAAVEAGAHALFFPHGLGYMQYVERKREVS